MKRRRFIFLITFVCLLSIVLIHNVPKKVTKTDKQYLNLFLNNIELIDASDLSYRDQINYIKKVQKDIQEDVALKDGIAYSSPREPEDLFKQKLGLCYDIGRSIEKALLASNLKTRHVSVYKKKDSKFSIIKTLASPGVGSHSIQEVKTQNGWMLVDSNIPWLAIDTDGKPHSMKTISQTKTKIEWEEELPLEYQPFYSNSTVYIYGLLSRHGKFYPPYTPIPDYNLKDLLLQNI